MDRLGMTLTATIDVTVRHKIHNILTDNGIQFATR
jgi:hypothetical protein